MARPESHLTASELTALFSSGAISPVEYLNLTFTRIGLFEPFVNAFSMLDYDAALAAAKASERRWTRGESLGPLDGIPTTIKDIVWSRDWKTTYGSKVLASDIPADEDAPCVARLKEAGAVLIGMTTTPELGWKGVTDSPLLGVTRNPWDCNTTPGGSSGGAAVAAALDMGVLHMGTDGGGSIRVPAGFTGVVGHKPSFGRVPAYPMSAFGTVAHIGPIARTVRDAAQMLSVMARRDPRDWYALPQDNGIDVDRLERGAKGLKIAYSADLNYMHVDPDVAALVKRAAHTFSDLGAIVDEVPAPFANPQHIFEGLWFTGAHKRFGALPPDRFELLDEGLKEVVSAGSTYGLADYLTLTERRADLGARMSLFHEDWDLLLTPTLPFAAFTAGMETPDGTGRWIDWAGFNYPFNLSQQPACSVPCGLTEAGLPVGLQIIGPMFADAAVLRAARAYEQTRDWAFPVAPRLGVQRDLGPETVSLAGGIH